MRWDHIMWWHDGRHFEGILFQKTLLRTVLQSRSQGKGITVGGDRQQRVGMGVFRNSAGDWSKRGD